MRLRKCTLYAEAIAGTYRAKLLLAHAPFADRLRALLPGEVDPSLPLRFEVAFGALARTISRVAAESQADLVVIAVHSAIEVAAHEPEQTAYRVIRWSHCPVLTIPRLAQMQT